MWRLHMLTLALVGLKLLGWDMSWWVALLPSYIFHAALVTVVFLGWLTGRMIVSRDDGGDDERPE